MYCEAIKFPIIKYEIAIIPMYVSFYIFRYGCSGDLHMITITDMFGFECFFRNRTEQLMINSLNEQIQYHYNQRMFVWEMMEQVC